MSYRSKNELNITGPMDANSRIIYAMADMEQLMKEEYRKNPNKCLRLLTECYGNAMKLAKEIDKRFLGGEPWTQEEIDEFFKYLHEKYKP